MMVGCVSLCVLGGCSPSLQCLHETVVPVAHQVSPHQTPGAPHHYVLPRWRSLWLCLQGVAAAQTLGV